MAALAEWAWVFVFFKKTSAKTKKSPPPEDDVFLVLGEGFEPSKAYAGRFTVWCVWPLHYPSLLMEPAVGLEPTTYGLQNRCSTNWAKPARFAENPRQPLVRRLLNYIEFSSAFQVLNWNIETSMRLCDGGVVVWIYAYDDRWFTG